MNTTFAASPKQAAFITRLLAEKDLTGTAIQPHTVTPEHLSSRAASSLIDALLALPRKQGGMKAEPAPEGMHKFGGVFFKVQRAVHGSGQVYAKALVQDAESKSGWRFEFVSGAVRNLSAATRLPLEEAKAFGALYGTCCACGRTLTDEGSIAAGIGPVCAEKF